MSLPHDLQAQAGLRLCYGVRVPLPAGPCTLATVLHDVLGLTPDYVRVHVQTILLDGLAVDDLDSHMGPDARLALSAAMPGVVGATLRKGGHYAPMRQGITHPGDKARQDHAGSAHTAPALPPRWLELRCFNDIAQEQARPLLQRGYLIPADGLTPALENLAASLPAPITPLPPLPAPAPWPWLWVAHPGEHA